jgi:hypothetical protein
MELKKLKLYALVLSILGVFIAFMQLLKLNDLRYFFETNKIAALEPPSLALNYMFLILLLAIIASFFILLYFGLQTIKVTVADVSMPELTVKEVDHKDEINLEKVENNIKKINDLLAPITDKKELFTQILMLWAKEFNIVQGIAYEKAENNQFKLLAKYAYYVVDKEPTFTLNEGLPGQVAADRKMLYINNIPDNYIMVLSGLGSSSPKYFALLPIVKNDETIALIEIAAFSDFSKYLNIYYEAMNNLLVQKL